MQKALAVVLIAGFLTIDFLFFHDVLKPGETITFAQYLTGIMSVPVLAACSWILVRDHRAV